MLDFFLTLAQQSTRDREIAIILKSVGPIVGGAIAAVLAGMYWSSPRRFVRIGWSLWIGSAVLLASLYLTSHLWPAQEHPILTPVVIIACIAGVLGFITGASMIGISERERRTRGDI